MNNPSLYALVAITVLGWNTMTHAKTATDAFEQYVKLGDTQNHQALETVLHTDFVSNYVFKGEDKVSEMDRDTFLKMFKLGKFGGNDRTIAIHSVTSSKNLVLLDARLQGVDLVFSGTFVMQQDVDGWKLKEEFLIVEKKS